MTFTVYNYVIYVVAIDFGPLFLLWVAVLGAALFCLVGGVGAADYAAEPSAIVFPGSCDSRHRRQPDLRRVPAPNTKVGGHQ